MMNNALSSAALLTDTELLEHVQRCATSERDATARLLAALTEVDARRLYLGQGCSSLFTYCTQILHLSEHAAYGRIEAARVARKFPAVLDLLADGSLHLTALSLLAPHLTVENHAGLLASAKHKSKREVEQLVAAVRPPPVPSTIRKLPSRTAASLPTAGSTPEVEELKTAEALPILVPVVQPKGIAEVKPLAPEHYKVQFTASQETYDKLKFAQDLLRHTIPSGDVAAVIDRALTLLVQELQRTRHAAVNRLRAARASATRSSSRYVAAAVKREVWRRDGGQCAFVGTVGRCTERAFLEYHHRVPFAEGGAATSENLELRCRVHNANEAERWFGSGLVREVSPSFIACASGSGDLSPETEPRGDPQRLFF
jgi:5-methylcytosine-specific restriction endonuclease McrA